MLDTTKLFQVSDVFHKAIESVPSEKIESGNSDLKTLYDGLVMTENQLLSVSLFCFCKLNNLEGLLVFIFPSIQR